MVLYCYCFMLPISQWEDIKYLYCLILKTGKNVILKNWKPLMAPSVKDWIVKVQEIREVEEWRYECIHTLKIPWSMGSMNQVCNLTHLNVSLLRVVVGFSKLEIILATESRCSELLIVMSCLFCF